MQQIDISAFPCAAKYLQRQEEKKAKIRLPAEQNRDAGTFTCEVCYDSGVEYDRPLDALNFSIIGECGNEESFPYDMRYCQCEIGKKQALEFSSQEKWKIKAEEMRKEYIKKTQDRYDEMWHALRLDGLSKDPEYKEITIDDFNIFGDDTSHGQASSEVAKAIFDKVATSPRKYLEEGFRLYLCGQPGVGKTHLLMGLHNAIRKSGKFTVLSVSYSNLAEIATEFVMSKEDGKMKGQKFFHKILQDVDFLFIDDILGGNISNFKESFLTEKVYNARKQGSVTITTGNIPVAEIIARIAKDAGASDAISKRLVDRMTSYSLKLPDVFYPVHIFRPGDPKVGLWIEAKSKRMGRQPDSDLLEIIQANAQKLTPNTQSVQKKEMGSLRSFQPKSNQQ